MILAQEYLLVFFFLMRRTVPKEPVDNIRCTFSEDVEKFIIFEGDWWESGLLLFLLHLLLF